MIEILDLYKYIKVLFYAFSIFLTLLVLLENEGCMFVLCVYLFVYIFAYSSARTSVYLYNRISTLLPVCLSIRLSICLSIRVFSYLFNCLSVGLSVCLFIPEYGFFPFQWGIMTKIFRKQCMFFREVIQSGFEKNSSANE